MNNFIIFFSKSDLARNKFSNIDENSSNEEIISELKKYYGKNWIDVDVKIENDTITIQFKWEIKGADSYEIDGIAKLAQQWQFERARKKLKELLDKYPWESDLYRLYWQTLSDEWKVEEAEKRLIDCLKYNPDNKWWLVMLWNIYNQLWKKDLAKKLYKRALEKDDNDIYALSNYWALCLEMWDNEDAEDVLLKAYEINKEYWITNYSLWILFVNKKEYLKAFDYILAAWDNIDKNDPRTQSVMKMILKICIAWDEDIVIEALYIPFKEKLEKELWKKIIFRKDDWISQCARVKIAEYYWTDEHIVLFNPNNHWYKYCIMHELTHLKMISEARKQGSNLIMTSSFEQKENLLNNIKDNSNYMQIWMESSFNSWVDNILLQVYNSPLDLLVENYLYNEYKELRPSQLLFQLSLISQWIQVAQDNELKKRVPEIIYNANVIMNSISAQQIKDLYWIDKTEEFGHNDLVRIWKKLYDKFFSKKDTIQPWEEYELVKLWAEKLWFLDYFSVEKEDLDKDNTWNIIKDDSEQLSIDEVTEEAKKIWWDSSDINMAVVMYCLAAIRFFKNKSKREIEMIWYELAVSWSNWIKYWEDSKYHINSIPWKEFTWYEFLSYMYVAWQILKPEADLWLDYSREYELAKQLDSKE